MHNSTLAPMNALNSFSWVFLAALAAATATRLWLGYRQIRHVRAHRDAVPTIFAESIPAEPHRKAADYTVVKARLGVLPAGFEALAALGLTPGRGGRQRSALAALPFPARPLRHCPRLPRAL